MPFTAPEHYYNRFDPTKNYEQHLFRAGYVMQSAEFNEVQSAMQHRLQKIADTVLKDGDIVTGANISVSESGACQCQSGAIYLRGAVRGIESAILNITTTGTVQIGAYLIESVVSELEDPVLRDPAIGMRNYQEPGALRLKTTVAWGISGDTAGDFYPVWTVIDGTVIPREVPPSIDAISTAIATYDRQSTGGNYIVSGMRVTAMADLPTGEQVYSVDSGEARINGRGVSLTTSRRNVYAAVPDLRRINNEPRVSTGTAAQRINCDRAPIAALISVVITAEKTANLTHGAFTGAMDSLPDSAVLELLTVTQGVTTFALGTDYRLTSGKVDWSLPGNEPTPGSSYSVTYRYITNATPTAIDETGFTVSGAVAGTLVQTTYDAKLPRIDRLCINLNGDLTWVTGIAADENPLAPAVPNDLLLLSTITQTWRNELTRTVRNDGAKVVPMSDIESIRSGMRDLYELVAQQQLRVDANSRLSAASKGLFVDAFRSNDQRDRGVTQDAVAFNGVLMMPISEAIEQCPVPGNAAVTLAHTHSTAVAQTMRTMAMQVNPYMAFEPIPAQITLNPASDHAVQSTDIWAPDVFIGSGNASALQGTAQIGETIIETYNLRTIPVRFSISGFGPGERLNQVLFDGIDVTNSVGA